MFGTMFQIIYFKIWRKKIYIIVCLVCVCVCVCVCVFFEVMKRIIFYLWRVKKKEKKKREGKSGGAVGGKERKKII